MKAEITKFDINARGLPIISDDGIWVSLADHQAAVDAALSRPARALVWTETDYGSHTAHASHYYYEWFPSNRIGGQLVVNGVRFGKINWEVEHDYIVLGYCDTLLDAQAAAEADWQSRNTALRSGGAAVIPQLERLPTNWRPLHEYVPANPDCELVQVLCEVIADENNEIDHISSGDHAVGDQFVSIGVLAPDVNVYGVPEWLVAGWCMNQDCFTDARCFKVVAWQPLAIIDLPHGGGE